MVFSGKGRLGRVEIVLNFLVWFEIMLVVILLFRVVMVMLWFEKFDNEIVVFDSCVKCGM